MRMEKLYKISFFILLILNVALLYFSFSHTGPPRGHIDDPNSLKERIVEELGFDHTQETRFLQLANGHRDEMTILIREQKELAQHYFRLLKQDDQEGEKERISKAIQLLEAKKLEVTYSHLEEVKQLCTAEQKEAFSDLVEMITQTLMRKNPPKK